MMRNGFTYEGQEFQLRGAFMVGANPTESPSSSEFGPLFIARIQAHQESLDQWFGMIEGGDILIYVSDGDPGTITIPDPVPNSLDDQYDAETIVADGHRLVRYSPDIGQHVPHDLAHIADPQERSAMQTQADVRSWERSAAFLAGGIRISY